MQSSPASPSPSQRPSPQVPSPSSHILSRTTPWKAKPDEKQRIFQISLSIGHLSLDLDQIFPKHVLSITGIQLRLQECLSKDSPTFSTCWLCCLFAQSLLDSRQLESKSKTESSSPESGKIGLKSGLESLHHWSTLHFAQSHQLWAFLLFRVLLLLAG